MWACRLGRALFIGHLLSCLKVNGLQGRFLISESASSLVFDLGRVVGWWPRWWRITRGHRPSGIGVVAYRRPYDPGPDYRSGWS